MRAHARYAFRRILDWSNLGPPHRRHSSPTEMVKKLKWQSLEHRSHTAKLTMMYTIQHGLVDIPLSKYTQPARTHCATEHLAAGPYNPWFNAPGYKHSFFISSIEHWNKLTAQTIYAPSIEAFKQCLEHDSTALYGCDYNVS